MRITPTCVPCLIKRVAYEAELYDPTKAEAAIKAACKVFGDHYTGKEVSARLATLVHKAAYEAIGTKDPYKRVKDESNEVAKGLVPKARKVIDGAEDKLMAAMKCAIIGNIMDRRTWRNTSIPSSKRGWATTTCPGSGGSLCRVPASCFSRTTVAR
jgi:uncharacterized protein with ATP-grasp and redox domains